MAMLESFIGVRLKLFSSHRNDPNAAALSQLSPWIRFGQYCQAINGAWECNKCFEDSAKSKLWFKIKLRLLKVSHTIYSLI